MANTLTNFLVGVGLDFDEDSAKKVDGALDGVKSRALQVGAVLAGAFGAKALTADFAALNDRLGKFSETFGVLPNDVSALGRALQHEGGNLESFLGQLEGLERMRAGLMQGDAEFLAAAGRAGIDPSVITNAENATEAYIALADQFERMAPRQRLNAAAALGLDEASIRLLSSGEAAVRSAMAAEQQMRPVTDEMTDSAATFNDEMQDLFTNLGGFADRISVKLLPEINEVVGGMNDWVNVNREFINQGLDRVLDPMAEHFEELAGAGALLATGGMLRGLGVMARHLPIIGRSLSVAATAAGRLTIVGAGVTAGASMWDWGPDEFEEVFGVRPPDWLFTPMGELFEGGDSSSAPPPTDAPAPDQYREGPPDPITGRRALTPEERERSAINTPWGWVDMEGLSPDEVSRLLDITTPAAEPGASTGSPTDNGILPGGLPSSGTGGDASPTASLGGGRERPIEVIMQIDGREVDRRIIAVNEERDRQTLAELESNRRA